MSDYSYVPSQQILSAKQKENPKQVEVIGIPSAPRLIHRELPSGSGVPTTDTLDQVVTFGGSNWYALSANQVRIQLDNDSGAACDLQECSIRGLLVYRLSGAQGYTHDKYSNYEDIQRNGETKFELSNNMICNLSQINSLADYWWKFLRDKKHIYEVTLHGQRHWYKLGLWYTLQIGGAGEAEYIDSTVRLIGKTVTGEAGTLGTTKLTFIEVEENWKFDSNETARFVAAGLPIKKTALGNVVSVAASSYCGDAPYMCDGTDDQVQIQAAIDYLKETYGGGTVHLTRGTFNITAAIEGESNITIQLEDGAILERNCNDYCIECIGTSGNEKTNFNIIGGTIKRNTSDTTVTYSLIYLEYCINSNISNCYFTNFVYAVVTLRSTVNVEYNYFSGEGQWSVYFSYSEGRICNNIFKDLYFYSEGNGNGLYAILVVFSSVIISNNVFSNLYFSYGTIVASMGIRCYKNDNTQISNNKITNVIGSAGTLGIHIVTSNNCNISNNYIESVSGLNFVSGTQAFRVEAGCINTKIANNYCIDNGNLISYGHCESASPPQTDGNLATNTSAARDATEPYWGTYSYKITKTNAAGTGASYWFVDNNTTTDLHGVGPKQGSYTLKMWVYVPSTGGPAAAEVRAVISEYDGGWNDTTDAMVDQNSWTELECSVTIDSGSTGFRCGIEFLSTAAVNEFVYIDNVRLIPGGIANAHGGQFVDNGTNTILG